MDDNLIPARAVTGLLREILSALDVHGTIYPARAALVVFALRNLLAGPEPADGDLLAITSLLAAHLTEDTSAQPPAGTAAAAVDPQNGPFATREHAETVFSTFREAALHGQSGPPGEQLVFTAGQHLADALTDSVEGSGAELGDYDRVLIGQLAADLDPVDVGVICSWMSRVTRDSPAPGIHIGAPRLLLPEADQ